MVELQLRSSTTFFGTFKIPSSSSLLLTRIETNLSYFSANYILLLGLALLLAATFVGRISIVLAVLSIVSHATCKTRSIKSKAHLLWQKHRWAQTHISSPALCAGKSTIELSSHRIVLGVMERRPRLRLRLRLRLRPRSPRYPPASYPLHLPNPLQTPTDHSVP